MKAKNKIGKTITAVAASFVMMAGSTFASIQGPFGASAFTNYSLPGSSTTWRNVGNVEKFDDIESNTSSFLSVNGSFSDYLFVSDLNFTMLSTEKVAGIFVEVSRRTSNASKTKDHSIRLFVNGAPAGAEYATSASWSSSNTYNSYGGESDLWGTVITNEQITNEGFGVGISVEKTSGNDVILAYIDYVKITLYTIPISLPVEMANMQVLQKQSYVYFVWSTLSEVNSDYFEVQKSDDGVDFTKVGEVKGNGNSSQIHTYEFHDKNPIAGINYYRVKQVDFDGQSVIYPTLTIECNTIAQFSMSVFPNPIDDFLRISLSGFDERVTVQINDLKGVQVYFEAVSSVVNKVELNTKELNLEAGLYYLSVSSVDLSKTLQKAIVIQ